jgi:hypothetical protein
MGLMYGGLQRLGPFPLLLALYLQFRGWKWGEWRAVFDVGWVGALLIFGLTLLYLLGWMLIGQRKRLDTYVALQEASIQEPEPASAPRSNPGTGIVRLLQRHGASMSVNRSAASGKGSGPGVSTGLDTEARVISWCARTWLTVTRSEESVRRISRNRMSTALSAISATG